MNVKLPLIQFLDNRFFSALSNHILGTGVPIFMLHRMVPDGSSSHGHTPSYLRLCLNYLRKNGYDLVSVEDILQHLNDGSSLPKKAVAFTMDDGFHEQAELAAPTFIDYDCPATIFLITGFLDDKLWPWFSKVKYLINTTETNKFSLIFPHGEQRFSISDSVNKKSAYRAILETMKSFDIELISDTLEQLSEVTDILIPTMPPEDYRPMTWDIARTLESSGIRLGPHTINHPILTRENDKNMHIEIAGSWKRLTEELSSPSPVFCYPNGRSELDFGTREIDEVRNSGLIGAVSTDPGHVETTSIDKDYLFSLPRLPMPQSFSDFVMYCSWIEFAKDKFRGKMHVY